MKRNEISHKMIFELDGRAKDFELFQSIWMNRIETEKYLKYDKLYPNVSKSMEMLVENNNLILLTARQNARTLKQELYQFALKKYFSRILVTGGKSIKESILESFLQYQRVKNNTIYISDMGQDIFIGNKIGIKTIAITHGFMNEERLLEYNPDYIVGDFCSLVTLIMRL